MALTNVSDVEVTGSPTFIIIKCQASFWGDLKREQTWEVRSAQHFSCCGMRTMQGMNVFTLAPEFQTILFCRMLRDALQGYYFRGGNVSFVLNTTQRNQLSELLKNMNRIGAGIKEIPFANKNMRNTNYLYIWTYTGRKPKKAEVVANVPSEN